MNEGSGTILQDKSGNGNNGAIFGAAWDQGIDGSALHFNGISDYVMIPDNAILNVYNLNAFSVCAWVKGPRSQAEGAGIVAKGSGGLEEYCLDDANNGYRFLLRNTSASYTMIETQIYPNNTWDFLVGVYDRTQGIMNFFVNGVLRGSQYPPSSLYHSAEPLCIGSRKDISSSSFDLPFNGVIDDVRLYARALTAVEVKSIYSNPPNLVPAFSLIPVPSPSFNRRPVLRWNPVPNATIYLVQVDTSYKFQSPLLRFYQTDTLFKMSVDLPIDTFYWQVSAGVNDTLRYFSEIGSFVVQDSLIPILIPYLPKVTREKTPNLMWHPVSGNATYTIQVATNSYFLSPIMVVPLADTQFKVQSDLPDGKIFWRVKSNLNSGWSTVDTFLVQTDSIPFLIRYNGAIVNTQRPLFHWFSVKNANLYKIDFADNSGFLNKFTIPLTDSFYTPTADLTKGMWYWRVSCDRNLSLFSPPDSLVIVSTSTSADKGLGLRQGRNVTVAAVDNRLVIQCPEDMGAQASISIYNMKGQRVFAGWMGGSSFTMRKSDFTTGLYILEIRSPTQMVMQKFCVSGGK